MEDISLKDEMREIKELVQGNLDGRKSKRFKPWGAKIGKGKLKNGYVVVCQIDDNKVVTFKKEPIIHSTIKLGDTIHAVHDQDVFYYQPIIGKTIPLIFQPKRSLNPVNILQQGKDNETYGQSYVMARMKGDLIKPKGTTNWLVFLIVIAVIGGGAYYLFNGGL